jgi:hypothetical protein
MKHKVRIIPKEEILANRSNAYEFIDFDKQETLEEAAENHAKIFQFPFDCDPAETFIAGAKWQQERSYSEEEVLNILDIMLSEYRDSLENKTDFYPALRFEKFKKK